MCDYSLQGLPNRLAVDGEHLVTHRFRTGSVGLASPSDVAAQYCPQPDRGSWWSRLGRWLTEPAELPGPPAVCIAHGTRLLMSRIPERLRREYSLRTVEPVKFVQLSAEAFQYRDGIEFANGLRLGLQSFWEGIAFEVVGPSPQGAEDLQERLTICRSEERRAGDRAIGRR